MKKCAAELKSGRESFDDDPHNAKSELSVQHVLGKPCSFSEESGPESSEVEICMEDHPGRLFQTCF